MKRNKWDREWKIQELAMQIAEKEEGKDWEQLSFEKQEEIFQKAWQEFIEKEAERDTSAWGE